jgi:hypothetical protein
MKFLIFPLVLLLVVSCTSVEFSQPQPVGGERLTTMPAELLGTWHAPTGESLIFKDNYVQAQDFKKDSLGTVVDTTYEYTYLADSTFLLKADKYFVFNELTESGTYRIMVAQQEKKDAIGFYLCLDAPFYGKIKSVQLDSADVQIQYYDEDLGEEVYYDSLLIQPSSKDLMDSRVSLISTLWIGGQLRTKDLKKICREEYLYFRLMPDGTIQLPKKEEVDIEEEE